MLESAIRDRTEELWLQKEIAKAGRVYSDVAAFLAGFTAGDGEVALVLWGGGCSAVGGCFSGLNLLIGVVDQVFFVRHGGL